MNNRERRNNNSSERPEMPENMEGMGTPPEMECDDEESCEMPEMPEDFDGEMPEMGEMGDFMKGMFTQEDASATSSDLHPAAYLSIGAGSVIFGILISYMCFSMFFRKRPGETFSTLSKFVWFIVVALILAAGISVLGYFIPVWING